MTSSIVDAEQAEWPRWRVEASIAWLSRGDTGRWRGWVAQARSREAQQVIARGRCNGPHPAPSTCYECPSMGHEERVYYSKQPGYLCPCAQRLTELGETL